MELENGPSTSQDETQSASIPWNFDRRAFLMRSAVLSAREVLSAATHDAAEVIQMSGKVGELRPGCLADLIVLDGNPLANLSVFDSEGTSLAVVMKEGEIFKNTLKV